MVIRIVAQASGAGLCKDMAILASVLKDAGHQVEEVLLPIPSESSVKWRNFYDRFTSKYCPRTIQNILAWLEVNCLKMSLGKQSDVNIYLENLYPRLIKTAKYNLMIPNQEWFNPGLKIYLPWIDLVLCKTREAEKIFTKLGCNTRFISFTSVDSWRPHIAKDFSLVLHFAGNGLTKGTKALLNVWSKHPEWPDLWISRRKVGQDEEYPRGHNIHYFDRFLREDELPELQSRCGIYIGPSEAEGFGHALAEAQSAKAIVITTDAPPMNELVRPERGFLVSYRAHKPRRLGTSFFVDEGALENTILKALALTEDERSRMGEAARKWYLTNDKFFREAVIATLKELQVLNTQQEKRQLYGNVR